MSSISSRVMPSVSSMSSLGVFYVFYRCLLCLLNFRTLPSRMSFMSSRGMPSVSSMSSIGVFYVFYVFYVSSMSSIFSNGAVQVSSMPSRCRLCL